MGSRPTPDFARLIARPGAELEARGIPFMLIGGQAVLLHGEPRLTQDVDVTMGSDPTGSRISSTRAKHSGSSHSRTILTPSLARRSYPDPETGVRVDLNFSTTPYEAQAIERAILVDVASREVPFATAGDLLLQKLFAGRPRDLEDAAGVVRRKGPELDWEYLRRWAREFAMIPGREDMPAKLDALRGED